MFHQHTKFGLQNRTVDVDSVLSAPSKVTVACLPESVPLVFPSVFAAIRRSLPELNSTVAPASSFGSRYV